MASPFTNEPIAIVGSACRFPGDASSPSKLWKILRDPVDLRQEIPRSRFDSDGFYHPNGSHHGHTNVRHAHVLNQDVAVFDAEFFGIKPVEAKAMDPQQRLLLEVVYEGLESAGMPFSDLGGSDTGVFVGVMFQDYGAMLLRDVNDLPTYTATGTSQSILSNRISYFFDWHGASVTVDTACSSSLVATHMAVQALRSGESRMALACGANLMLGPEGFVIESKLNMLSPTGRSRMWDAGADGYARGEGVGALILKTLSAAIEDGDHIECIIRETGTNQDGATSGITVPNAAAQESLIRATYGKAGLDLLKSSDRPQYFEAHGTGTPAGDPIEAEAIQRAFFLSQDGDELPNPLTLGSGHPLYVGSMKTIFGHTEGAAGVAALMKASLALQRGDIPPNLHFERLSDRVAPFYQNVEISRTPRPWPTVEGGVRRASINSFGFGGANAHAILEGYDNGRAHSPNTTTLFTPCVFSAHSESSLLEILSDYANYLEGIRDDPDVNLQDLAWTLRQRRSEFPYRASFTSSSIPELRDKIRARLEDKESSSIATKALSSYPSLRESRGRILGIFTGQGAQYARMGAELIEQSSTARGIIRQLEKYLMDLPETDRPSWSLEAELLADASTSRLHEAAIAQPLCTALQILLVDLLKLAGVQFSAVVGHSSGEISAAYTTGYLSARDAMLIAYYRGLHASLAASPNGSDIRGAMIAVGNSINDMVELCEDEAFEGRLTVAASNSSSNVTISGDEDAIEKLELVLDDENTFHRRLRVDKAYHSRHMVPCFSPYVDSLRHAGIVPRNPHGSEQQCIWFSSVGDGRPVTAGSDWGLSATYWAENMTKPVLFSQALSSALRAGSCGLVLEVGPHPTLKSATKQVVMEVLGKDLPYQGLLMRGLSAVDASSSAMGFLWSYLAKSDLNLDQYERAIAGIDSRYRYRLIKGLPIYRWNHETRYWHESRSSRKMRLRQHPTHPLLGDVTTDSSPNHMSWRNLLRVSEMEWLTGHVIQGQVVFPAAGYMASALEAAGFLARGSDNGVRLIEIGNFAIHHAVMFEQDSSSIEVLIEMTEIAPDFHRPMDLIRARFTYSAALDPDGEDLTVAASGDVTIHLGEGSPLLLPARPPMAPHMINVKTERFYSALADLGYNFDGQFRSLSGLQKKRGKATCLVKMQLSPFLIHPAQLDAVLQSAILAYSYPYDDELQTLHLPTTIRTIRVNPAALLDSAAGRGGEKEFMMVDASSDFADSQGTRSGIAANINLYATAGRTPPSAAVQVQGVTFTPMRGLSSAEEDRNLYCMVNWIPDRPVNTELSRGLRPGENKREVSRLLERIATFYLRKFDREISQSHTARATSRTKWYLNLARHVSEVVESGKHKWWREEWRNDTPESLLKASQPYMHLPDIQLMHLVGAQMPRVFAGKTTMLEEFRAGGNDVLDRYYAEGIGLEELTRWVGRAVKQLADLHPHMNILEVGAGTGAAAKAIFNEIGDAFRSYTYTDISAGFFDNASIVFSKHRSKMVFKTLDLERDPKEQDFAEGAYDLIVAYIVIHATSDLESSLRNLRKLLKPGGFLVMGEGSETGTGFATIGFIFGTLPGWWIGVDHGRVLSPLVSPKEWDDVLKRAGFSGADATTPRSVGDPFNAFPVVTQAVDAHINFLREPLTPEFHPAGGPLIEKLILIGGETARSSHIVQGLHDILREAFATETHRFKRLTDVDFDIVDAESTIVSLTELDFPVFRDITPERFDALKKILERSKTMLLVTSGRLRDNPFANISATFHRVAANETPDMRLQELDISDPEQTSPTAIAETLLRLTVQGLRGHNNNVLWVFEPEVIIGERGRQLVPRVRFIDELNDRYNAGRRPVVRNLNVQASPATIVLEPSQDGGYMLKEASRYETELLQHRSDSESLLELRTTHAIISALKTPLGHKFLVIGVLPGTKTSHLALVSSLSSIFRVPRDCTVACEVPGFSDEDVLRLVAAHLVSLAVLDPMFAGQTCIAHNAPSVIADALEVQAATKGVHLVNLTDSFDKDMPASWVRLPRYISEPELDEILAVFEPPAVFAGFSTYDIERLGNEATILSRLGPQCHHTTTANSLYSSVAHSTVTSPQSSAALQDRLRTALAFANKHLDVDARARLSSSFRAMQSVRLEALSDSSRPLNPLTVINWMDSTSAPVHVTRLDAGRMFKGAGSTYWIVGITRALGISLADWMIGKGARNVVMTSRQPDIAPEWIASHRRKGANVTIIPCDVTDYGALKETHQKICDTLPTIAGVIHGAMVLHDTSVSNMSFDQLTSATRPKVDGSRYLDRIFWDIDLDFFVMTSSVNSLIANLGQANYASANSFMRSLAAQRRKRGLRAAAVNVGTIMGAGYLEREKSRDWDRTSRKNYLFRMSEDDFAQAVCEAIDASRLDSPYGPEISTGLKSVPADAADPPFWLSDPKFSFFITHQQALWKDEAETKAGARAATTSIQDQLESCQSQQEIYRVIEHAFAGILRGILQVNMSDEDLMASHSNEIGLDSLVSVNIRSWFLKHLQVGIPVLRVMSSGTMGSIVQLAVEAMPPELVPQLHVPNGFEDDGDARSMSSSSEPPEPMN
ncbi:hypothetical protein DL770_011775 [Monosporascus sp. CRB-9-2]|nr:hypothetical protein DL770_011775 [Monosporascus sp. CRB-9-2]